MSKICVIVITNDVITSKSLVKEDLKKVASQYGNGIWFYEKYNEPFIKHYCSYFVISFSDGPIYDNCEMLLLPDKCSYNGKINRNSFYDRIKIIEDTAKYLNTLGYAIEIFIGESGTEYEEFLKIECSLDDITNVICQNFFNEGYFCENDLHIILNNFDM